MVPICVTACHLAVTTRDKSDQFLIDKDIDFFWASVYKTAPEFDVTDKFAIEVKKIQK